MLQDSARPWSLVETVQLAIGEELTQSVPTGERSLWNRALRSEIAHLLVTM